MLKFALSLVIVHFNLRNVKGLDVKKDYRGQLEMMYMKEFQKQIFTTGMLEKKIPNDICKSSFDEPVQFMKEILTKNPSKFEMERHNLRPGFWARLVNRKNKYTDDLRDLKNYIFWEKTDSDMSAESAYCNYAVLHLNDFHPKYKITTYQEVLIVKSPLKKEIPLTNLSLMMMSCEGGYFLLAPANRIFENAGQNEAVIQAFADTNTGIIHQAKERKWAPLKPGPSFKMSVKKTLNEIKNDVQETLDKLPSNRAIAENRRFPRVAELLYYDLLPKYVEPEIIVLEEAMKEQEKKNMRAIAKEIERKYGSGGASSSKK